jgi:DNA repair protein RecO (recombination protein O)
LLGFEDSGVVLSLRAHGETGGIASILTRNNGRALGYVYGASSQRLRGTTEIGSRVAVRWQARAADQLGTFTVEPESSVTADVMDDPDKMTALQSACAIAEKTLPEREKHPRVYEAFCVLLDAFATDLWPVSYIAWELGLLAELGFGLDLSSCAATGATDDLIYVSPRSGRAVSAAAGAVYKEKMLHLPGFLRGRPETENADILQGLQLTGHFLLKRVFAQSNTNLPEPRLRLEQKFTA